MSDHIKSGLEMLKIAVMVVLTGGAAAGTAAKFVVGSVESRLNARIEEHTRDGTIHTEDARRINALREEMIRMAMMAQTAATSAQWEAHYTRLMVERLLKTEGITPPPPPPPPKIDAGYTK